MNNKCDDDKHLNCISKTSYNSCVAPAAGINKDELICDGKWDCRDGYDEHGCRKNKTLINAPLPYLKPYQSYDMYDKVHCYKRDAAPFRPNINFDQIEGGDAVPCHDAISTCVSLKNFGDAGLPFQASFCPHEKKVETQVFIKRFAQNPCTNYQDHCDQLCFWNEPEVFDWSGDFRKDVEIGDKIEERFMSSYTCGCVAGYTQRTDTSSSSNWSNESKCKSDAGPIFYDLIMLASDEGEFLVQSVNPPKDVMENNELIEKTYFSSTYKTERLTSVVRYFETDLRNHVTSIVTRLVQYSVVLN